MQQAFSRNHNFICYGEIDVQTKRMEGSHDATTANLWIRCNASRNFRHVGEFGNNAARSAGSAPVPRQLLSADQLDYLVAPIALYPDPLISQILVATTYPLEIVEASQWLQRNPNLRDEALTQSALNQDWDPSVQALVVFPGVLRYLTEDISWTTNLGNAFLAQEGDVMDAIQRMRDRAARSGKLATTAEQQVIRVEDSGHPVYEILPANPTVMYVPVYDPYWIWGAPVYYPYARWYYPPHAPYLYFSSAVYIDAYFGSRWYGSAWYGPGYQVWNNWGWRPAWTSHNVVVNNVFIDNHHFNSNRLQNTTERLPGRTMPRTAGALSIRPPHHSTAIGGILAMFRDRSRCKVRAEAFLRKSLRVTPEQ